VPNDNFVVYDEREFERKRGDQPDKPARSSVGCQFKCYWYHSLKHLVVSNLSFLLLLEQYFMIIVGQIVLESRHGYTFVSIIVQQCYIICLANRV
jgi:hypothetical protein